MTYYPFSSRKAGTWWITIASPSPLQNPNMSEAGSRRTSRAMRKMPGNSMKQPEMIDTAHTAPYPCLSTKLGYSTTTAPAIAVIWPGRPPKRQQIMPRKNEEKSPMRGGPCAINANATDGAICAMANVMPAKTSVFSAINVPSFHCSCLYTRTAHYLNRLKQVQLLCYVGSRCVKQLVWCDVSCRKVAYYIYLLPLLSLLLFLSLPIYLLVSVYRYTSSYLLHYVRDDISMSRLLLSRDNKLLRIDWNEWLATKLIR